MRVIAARVHAFQCDADLGPSIENADICGPVLCGIDLVEHQCPPGCAELLTATLIDWSKLNQYVKKPS